jgi:hypothetical protein
MVVAQVCTDLAEKTLLMGPVVIAGCHQSLANYLLQLYERKAPCQQEWEDDEQELDEAELAEYYGYLMESVNELVSAMAQAMGPSFSNYLKVFLPRIMAYYDPVRRDSADRSLAVGSIAEIVGAMGDSITEFSPQIFPLVLQALLDEDDDVKSNAAFATGLLCLHTKLPEIKA